MNISQMTSAELMQLRNTTTSAREFMLASVEFMTRILDGCHTPNTAQCGFTGRVYDDRNHFAK